MTESMTDQLQIRITKDGYQDRFLMSEARFPAMIAGIGTGKTFMFLLKIWMYCEAYPNSIALIVRKEYTDLHDSTIKDFKRYFGVEPDSNKEHKFANGSVIMFRHAKEVEVLKNINLSIFGIEQAEEFDTDEQFTYLRDRLRNQNGPYRQGIIIANAQGHNWIWKMWINNPSSEEYQVVTATTFDNEANLPADFIKDLKAMEIDQPNHYKQYVMNSFEEVDRDDLLLSHEVIYGAPKIILPSVGLRHRVMGIDVARYGNDEISYCILESRGHTSWEQIHIENQKSKSLMETTGKALEMQRDFKVDVIVVDDTGVGGGVTDRLKETRLEIIPFNGGEACSNANYLNTRADAFFKLKEYLEKSWLKLLPDSELQEQLLTIYFSFKSNGMKYIVSKDEMRKRGIKSPDRADALMMALYYAERAFTANSSNLPKYGLVNQDLYGESNRNKLPAYGVAS